MHNITQTKHAARKRLAQLGNLRQSSVGPGLFQVRMRSHLCVAPQALMGMRGLRSGIARAALGFASCTGSIASARFRTGAFAMVSRCRGVGIGARQRGRSCLPFVSGERFCRLLGGVFRRLPGEGGFACVPVGCRQIGRAHV